MELALPEEFVLLDTEYTSWEGAWERGWSGPNEYKEIIQVGMIRIGKDKKEEASLKLYVKPVKNPILSDYIKNLTHISQEEVDAGITLEECNLKIKEFLGDFPAFAYGTDEAIIRENCELIGTLFPFLNGRIADIREIIFPSLEKLKIDPKIYTSGTLISAFSNQPLHAHDAVNDMRNLLEAIKEIEKRLL